MNIACFGQMQHLSVYEWGILLLVCLVHSLVNLHRLNPLHSFGQRVVCALVRLVRCPIAVFVQMQMKLLSSCYCQQNLRTQLTHLTKQCFLLDET